MADKCKKSSPRLIHLDLLRLMAIYFVIFNHTGDRGYMLFAERTDSPLYWLYLLTSVLCKVAVPLFFMISGALLLPREESLGRLFSKRVLRMTAVLALISVPYYLWLHRSEGLSLSSFLTYIYGNSASTSLWYLYSYIALLLMMPFLRSMVRSMTQGDFLYLIAGYLVMVGVVPCAEYCLWGGYKTIHSSFQPVLFLTQNVFFALLGYYVEHRAGWSQSGKKLIVPGAALNVLCLGVTVLMTHRLILSGEKDVEQLERFFNCFICIPTVTVYAAAKYAGGRIRSRRARGVLTALGGAVFGVYLIEKFGRALTSFVYVLLAPLVGSFAASLLWCCAVLLLSLAIVVSAKRMPGVGKVINRFI